ncbi:DNA topoisomerase III [Shewanella corallii]|uniref:DNA topoisomerase 3 n=1 Tax=Shewanella corallii TaxID=560080 RepID=A0ABT0NBD3_9GAMM|nr:DNA topoisomerase III [Shewanella corallii]MCL2915789.1 DNA topoisomerase III [Shewanella corallii]
MILYIAEKPSLGRAIADVLPKPHKKHDGYIEVGNGDMVSWCIGHLLEQAPPDAYDEKYKSWKMEDLPVVPEQWQLMPKSSSRSQLSVLRKLVKQADSLVHAGDPDREGQLLVDEVLSYLKVSQTKLGQTQRLLISDLNPQAVKRALSQLRSNREFVPLSTSALARSRADWLYGMNMTRAFTLQGRKVGYQGVLSVGRVQTPLLGLVVRRDETIEAFEPKPFYQVDAHLLTHAGERFTARWQPSEACQKFMDEEGRVLSPRLADNVVERITGQPGQVTALEQKDKRQAPPLLYSLSSLQIDAAKRFGLSAKAVLDTCQSLYERHKLITYPRSDSRHLPKEQLKLAPGVVDAVLNNAPALVQGADKPDLSIKSAAWNDSKVDAHHAIVPTDRKADLSKLSRDEARLYEHIARQYLAQFYPHHLYQDTKVEVTIAGGLFSAKAKVTRSPGWKQLFASNKASANESSAAASQGDDKEEEPLQSHLPVLKKGEELLCERGERLDKMTQPPKHFTDATLLSAMTGIGRYVKDDAIRKTLKDTDGLGTEATRAGIIELLFKRGFLVRQGKSIQATPVGRGLINSLPEAATTPDMTALWEQSLEAISQKSMRYQSFMDPLLANIHHLLEVAAQTTPNALAGVQAKPAWKGKGKGRGGWKKKSTGSSAGGRNTGTKTSTAKSAGSKSGARKPRAKAG